MPSNHPAIDPTFEAKKDALVEAIRQLARKHNTAHRPVLTLYLIEIKAMHRHRTMWDLKQIVIKVCAALDIPQSELDPIVTMLFEG